MAFVDVQMCAYTRAPLTLLRRLRISLRRKGGGCLNRRSNLVVLCDSCVVVRDSDVGFATVVLL